MGKQEDKSQNLNINTQMQDLIDTQLVKIGQASQILGVSIDTLRRWEKAGKIEAVRTPGGTRLYSLALLSQLQNKEVQIEQKKLHISQAAQKLGLSVKTLRRWDHSGKLPAQRDEHGERVYTSGQISNLSRQNFKSPITHIEKVIEKLPENAFLMPKWLAKTALTLTTLTALIVFSLTAGYFFFPKQTLLLTNTNQPEKTQLSLSNRKPQVSTQQGQVLGIETGPLSLLQQAGTIALFPFNALSEKLIQTLSPKSAANLGFTSHEQSQDKQISQTQSQANNLAQNANILQTTVNSLTDLLNNSQASFSGQIQNLHSLTKIVNTNGTNLLRNSSFEANSSDQPQSWFYTNQSTSDNTFVNNQAVRTGNLALRIKPQGISNTGTATSFGIYQPYFVTTAGKQYTLSAYLNNQSGQTVTLRLSFWDKNNKKTALSQTFPVSSYKDWQRYIFSLDPPSQGVDGNEYFPMIEILGQSQGNVFLDDIELSEGSASPVYVQNNTNLGDNSVFADANANIYPALNRNGSLGMDSNRFGSLYLTGGSIDSSGNTTLKGDVTINGTLTAGGTATFNNGTLNSSATSYNLLNTTVTTLNIGGAATAISIGAATGTTTINNTLAITGSTTFADGTVSSPGITFTNDTDTGIYRSGANTLDFSSGGVRTLSLNTATSGINYLSFTPAATGSGPTITAAGSDTNIGLTINSKAAGALTLDSATTGTVNLASGNNAKTINIGTGTAGNTINIGSNNTTADTITLGSALDSLALSSGNWSITSGGTASFNGNATFGDTTADTITFTGHVASSILPTTDGGYDLGSSALRFNNLYVATINATGTNTSGQAAFTYQPTSSVIGQGSVWINPTTASAARPLLSASVGGIEKARITTDGYLGLNGANDPGSTYIINAGTPFNVTTSGATSIATTNTTGADLAITNTGVYTGTGIFNLTANSATTGNLANISANGLTTGNALAVSSTSIAGGAAGSSYLLNLSRSGTNAQLAHTAYGLYSAVTNTNATSGTNIAGYFSASGATTANYGLIVANGNVGIGTTTPAGLLHVAGQCVTGDTLLKRRRKKKKNGEWIDEWEDIRIDQIEVGDEILTLDEKTGEFVPQKVKALENMGYHETFEMITESGKSIRTTANHPYLVNTGKKDNDQDEYTNFFYHQTFESVLKTARTFYREVLEGEHIRVKALGNKKIYFSREGWDHIYTGHVSKLEIMSRFFALAKIIPILKLAKTTTAEKSRLDPTTTFWALQGIIEGVWVKVIIRETKDKPKHFYSVIWKGEDHSKEVKNAIKKGAVSRLYPRIQAWDKSLTFSTLLWKKYIKFIEESQEAANKFNKLILPENRRDVRWTKVSRLKIGQKIATVNGWEKIIAIKKFAKEQTYDIEVEHTHNFVGNNIVAHNTAIFGAGEGGTPTVTTLRGAAAAGTNIAGANFTFDASNGTGTGGSGALIFRTAPTGTTGSTANTLAEIMIITPGGNVGIGTTSPDSKLDINLGTASAFQLTYNDSDGSAATHTNFTLSSAGVLTGAATGTGSGFALSNTQPASVGTSPGTDATSLLALSFATGGNTTIATTGVGGVGSGIAWTLGTGGTAASATTASTGGAGGAYAVTGGTGGASSVVGTTNIGGAGGAISLTGGTGGAASGATSNTGGAGGAITILAGSAGSGGNANGGTLTLNSGAVTGSGTSTLNLGSANATTVNLATATSATTLNIGAASTTAVTVALAGGSADTGCSVAGATGNLTCTGNITGSSSGTVGFWSRTSTTLSPATANDIVSIANTTTTGADLGITNTGVYTGTGIFNLTANSATTGTLAAITGNGLSSGNLLSLTSTSTQAASNTQKGLNIALSGTNATSAQTTYGAYISNTHAGTTSTNVGLYATATGGTTANYAAIFESGNVGIGTTIPGTKLDINGTSTQLRLIYGGDPINTKATFTVNNAGQLVMSAGNFQFDNSVGIGGDPSSTPVGKLVVYSGSASTKALIISQAGSPTANPFEIQNNATTVLASISSVGGAYFASNVGIGTTSPGSLLEVAGNILLSKETARTIQLVDSTTANTAGGALTIKSAAALGTTATAAGGALTLQSGAGGVLSATASTAGAGGLLSITGGAGGATSGVVTGSTVGGAGAGITLTGGAGGNAAGGTVSNTGGAGGDISITSGNAGTGGNANGGTLTLNSGAVTGSGTSTINLGSSNTTNLNIGTASVADTITIGNATGATSLAFTSGTGSQTHTSSVVSGTTTTSANVFTDSALTTGTLSYLTSSSITTGKLLDIADTNNTWTGNGTTNGLINLASSSTAGTASSQSILLNLSRSGANAQLAHTAYGLYSAVTNTNATGTNIAGYFSASGATTANYGLIVANGNVGIGTTAPTATLHVVGQCVTGDTLLKRRRRRKGKNGQWEDYWEDVEIKDIKKGDEILTLDETLGEFVPQKVKALMDMGSQEVFRLVTQFGKTIETTGNHPYLTIEKDILKDQRPQRLTTFEVDQSMRIEDKTADTILAIANKESSFLGKLDKKQKLALYLQYSKQNRPKIFGPEIFAKMIVATINKFDLKVTRLIIDREYSEGYDAVITTTIEASYPNIIINFKSVGKSSPAHIAAFTAHINRNIKKSKKEEVVANSILKGFLASELLHQAFTRIRSPHYLLLKFNYITKWEKVNQLKQGDIIATIDGWEKISAKYSTGRKQTWDIEVEGTHNFVGNNIVAHNTYINSSTATGIALDIDANSLSSGSGLDISSTSTAAASNTQKGLNIALSGTNATSAQTTYGAYISNTHAGTTSTNVGLYATASGGTTANYAAIFEAGNVGIGTATPQAILNVYKALPGAGTNIDQYASFDYGNPANRSIVFEGTRTSSAATQYIFLNGRLGSSSTTSTPTCDSPFASCFGLESNDTNLNFITGANNSGVAGGNTAITRGLSMNTSGNVGIGTTGPLAGLENATAGAASKPGELLSGTWFTGGTATTTKPQLLIEPTGTTSTGWSTSGTGIGVNGAATFAGNLLDLQQAGNSVFKVAGVSSAVDGFTFTTTAAAGTPAITAQGSDTNIGLSINSKGTGTVALTSANATGTTTASAFTLTDNSLTSGTGAYFTSSSITTGKLVDISNTANTQTSGTLFNISSTATSLTGTANSGAGLLANLDWSPGSAVTATGDLFRINIGTNGTTTGSLFNITDTNSSIFAVSENAVTTSLPFSDTASGDLSIAYDLNMTNPTASFIKSAAPLYLVAGETFNSSNLTLQTYNQGSVVIDSAQTTGNAVDITNSTLTTGNILGITETSTAGGTSGSSYILNIAKSGANANATHTSYGIASSVTNSGTTSVNYGGLFTATGATTNYGLAVAAMTGATSTGLDIGALSGATANYGINIGNLTSAATANNFGLKIGTITSQASATSYGISTGAISGAGTTTYGINLGANSSTATTNYGINIGAISGAGTTNYGLYVGAVSGATNNYAAIFAGGNVGIGTTSPLGLLEVRKDQGTNTTQIRVVNGTAGTASVASFYAIADNTAGVSLSALSASFTTSGLSITNSGRLITDSGVTGGLVLGTNGTNPLIFGTNGTENMRITSGGNVGIGTTAPTVQLDIRTLNTTTAGYMAVGNSDLTKYTAIYNGASLNDQPAFYWNTGSNMRFGVANTGGVAGAGFTEKMRIESGGNVGIGTTAPKQPGGLQLSNTASGYGMITSVGGSYFSANAYYDTSWHYIGVNKASTIVSNTDGGIYFYTTDTTGAADGAISWSQRVKIDSVGNIVIGTAALATTATNGFLYIPTSAGAPTGVPTTETGTVALEYDTTNNKLMIYNGGWKTTTGFADYSEWAPAANTDSGDIVTVTTDPNPVNDPTAPFMLGKTTSAYDTKAVGVISQYAEDAQMAYGYKKSADYHAVALVGRVPVKVSTENGPIQKGDYLTSSSTSGVAMKAIRAGQAIGKALEDYNGSGVGKILVFVNVSYADPGAALTNLLLDNDGSLIVPKLKSNQLLISAGVNITSLQLNNNLVYQTTTDSSNNTNYNIDVVGSLNKISDKLDQLDLFKTKQATDSAQLAQEVASQSATIAQTKSTTLTLAQQLASAAAGLVQVKSDVDTLKLTPPDILYATGSATLANLTVSADATISGKLASYDLSVSNIFKSLGKAILGDTTVAGDITQDGTLSISSGNSINVIGTPTNGSNLTNLANGILFLQNSNLAQGLDILAGKFTFDTSGKLTVAGEVQAKQFSVSSSTTTDNSTGTGIIATGSTGATITNSLAKANSIILITPKIALNQTLAVTQKADGSFTVSLARPETTNIQFDYLIIGVK